VAVLKSEVDSLRRQLAERDGHIATTEDLQLRLKKQLSSHVAEIHVSCNANSAVPVFNFCTHVD